MLRGTPRLNLSQFNEFVNGFGYSIHQYLIQGYEQLPFYYDLPRYFLMEKEVKSPWTGSLNDFPQSSLSYEEVKIEPFRVAHFSKQYLINSYEKALDYKIRPFHKILPEMDNNLWMNIAYTIYRYNHEENVFYGIVFTKTLDKKFVEVCLYPIKNYSFAQVLILRMNLIKAVWLHNKIDEGAYKVNMISLYLPNEILNPSYWRAQDDDRYMW